MLEIVHALEAPPQISSTVYAFTYYTSSMGKRKKFCGAAEIHKIKLWVVSALEIKSTQNLACVTNVNNVSGATG